MIYSCAVKAENAKSVAFETKLAWLQERFVKLLCEEIKYEGEVKERAGKYESMEM
jgi:hypothetical protein